MALPQDVLSTEVLPAAFTGGRSLPVSNTVDFETGGVALSDPTKGHLYQIWNTRVVDKTEIELSAEEVSATTIYSGIELTEVSLTFDQNMRPTYCFVEGGISKLRWFDSNIQDMTTTELGADVITPRVSLDDKRSTQMQSNDIILAYLRKIDGANNLYHRKQRDRFEIEYLLAEDIKSPGIIKIGMNRVNRFQFLLRYA